MREPLRLDSLRVVSTRPNPNRNSHRRLMDPNQSDILSQIEAPRAEVVFPVRSGTGSQTPFKERLQVDLIMHPRRKIGPRKAMPAVHLAQVFIQTAQQGWAHHTCRTKDPRRHQLPTALRARISMAQPIVAILAAFETQPYATQRNTRPQDPPVLADTHRLTARATTTTCPSPKRSP